MSEKSKIQWTDATWNIARGCTKVDEDCKFCYMYRDSFNSSRYDPLQIVRTKTVFNLPLRIKEPSKIFTSSLTDVFHEAIDGYRNEMWDIIRKCPQHTFQILTKRPERIKDHLPEDWGNGWDNVWLGTSVGSQQSDQRILQLLQLVPAKIKFLSLEPLHGPIDLMYPESAYPGGAHMCCSGINCSCYGRPTEPPLINGIDWVIVGGESGNDVGKYQYRPCELEWISNIINQCKDNNVPVFVKQLGTYQAKKLGLKDRYGGNINEWPEEFQIREFPE